MGPFSTLAARVPVLPWRNRAWCIPIRCSATRHGRGRVAEQACTTHIAHDEEQRLERLLDRVHCTYEGHFVVAPLQTRGVIYYSDSRRNGPGTRVWADFWHGLHRLARVGLRAYFAYHCFMTCFSHLSIDMQLAVKPSIISTLIFNLYRRLPVPQNAKYAMPSSIFQSSRPPIIPSSSYHTECHEVVHEGSTW